MIKLFQSHRGLTIEELNREEEDLNVALALSSSLHDRKKKSDASNTNISTFRNDSKSRPQITNLKVNLDTKLSKIMIFIKQIHLKTEFFQTRHYLMRFEPN